MTTTCDTLIIGGGLAGLAAARRALELDRTVEIVTASPGSLPYTSGALDVLAVYPTETKFVQSHPWEVLGDLIERDPEHPYGKVGLKGVRENLADFFEYLKNSPLAYAFKNDENVAILTGAGTLKPTYAVPGSQAANAQAVEERRPTLVAGIKGLTDFSARQVVENMQDRWPGLVAATLDLGEILADDRRVTVSYLAAEFEKADFRAAFAAKLKPQLGSARYLGLPALLGMVNVMDIVHDLETRLGVSVFEIPLLSPALPGMRLANWLRDDLFSRGAAYRQGMPIKALKTGEGRIQAVVRAGRSLDTEIVCNDVILATGRFFGGGLVASQTGVREPLLGLDLEVPPTRDEWHMASFLGAPGHALNRVGVEVDRQLRPLGQDGKPIFANCHAAGAVLAHHDWVREKSGAGISIATGVAAVNAAMLEH